MLQTVHVPTYVPNVHSSANKLKCFICHSGAQRCTFSHLTRRPLSFHHLDLESGSVKLPHRRRRRMSSRRPWQVDSLQQQLLRHHRCKPPTHRPDVDNPEPSGSVDHHHEALWKGTGECLDAPDPRIPRLVAAPRLARLPHPDVAVTNTRRRTLLTCLFPLK